MIKWVRYSKKQLREMKLKLYMSLNNSKKQFRSIERFKIRYNLINKLFRNKRKLLKNQS